MSIGDPNLSPTTGNYCELNVWGCNLKNVDFGTRFWWGNQLPEDEPSTIRSVILPAIPYAGDALPATASGIGWTGSIAWSPADTNAVLGTVYTATFALTGSRQFDPNVTVSEGTITVDAEDPTKAVAVVTYAAVVERPAGPVTPPAPGAFKGMVGAWEVLNYDPSAVGTPRPTGTLTTADFMEGRIFDVGVDGVVAPDLTTSDPGMWILASTRGAPLTRDAGLGPAPLPDTEPVTFTLDGVTYTGVLTDTVSGAAVYGNANWVLVWPSA